MVWSLGLSLSELPYIVALTLFLAGCRTFGNVEAEKAADNSCVFCASVIGIAIERTAPRSVASTVCTVLWSVPLS